MHTQTALSAHATPLAMAPITLLPPPKTSFFSLLRLDLSGAGARDRINDVVEGLATYYRDISFDRKWKRPKEGAFLIFGGWGPEVRPLSVVQPWGAPEGALDSFGGMQESNAWGPEFATGIPTDDSGGWVDFGSPWIFSINNAEAGNPYSHCWTDARTVLNKCLTHGATILVGIRL